MKHEEKSSASIKVEHIKGFVILTSGKSDSLWPSSDMCNSMIRRMEKNNFRFPYRHIAFEGGHQPSTHFSQVFELLDQLLT